MVLVDVNLPIHAVNNDSPLHEGARDWWDETLSGVRPVGLAWVVASGFVRITTNRRIVARPLTPAEATEHVSSWFEQPCVRVLGPQPGHWRLATSLLEAAGTAGNLTMDAHLAALAIEHGCELCSTDSDFARFPGLNWRNPLVDDGW